jgi:hypothetical protein
MKWLRITAIVLLVVVVAAFAAWQLWPVQIMVRAYRFTHRVEPNRPVRWAEGPAVAPAGPRPPNIVLIVADDLGMNDFTAEGPGTGVASGLVPTPNIAIRSPRHPSISKAHADSGGRLS